MNRREPVMGDSTQANLDAVEKAITQTQSQSFAAPEHRGIHELISEARKDVKALERLLTIIEERMEHFDDMQRRFYKGDGT